MLKHRFIFAALLDGSLLYPVKKIRIYQDCQVHLWCRQREISKLIFAVLPLTMFPIQFFMYPTQHHRIHLSLDQPQMLLWVRLKDR